jgi:hypothetical protein
MPCSLIRVDSQGTWQVATVTKGLTADHVKEDGAIYIDALSPNSTTDFITSLQPSMRRSISSRISVASEIYLLSTDRQCAAQ